MDFVADCLASGRKLRCLTIVDDFSRECPAIEVDTSITGRRVVAVLERLADLRGLPRSITVDHGPEVEGQVLDAWAYERGVQLAFIRPGKPVENAYIESFNGKFRDECLNQHWYFTMAHARRAIEAWRIEYNSERRTARSPTAHRRSSHEEVWQRGKIEYRHAREIKTHLLSENTRVAHRKWLGFEGHPRESRKQSRRVRRERQSIDVPRRPVAATVFGGHIGSRQDKPGKGGRKEDINLSMESRGLEQPTRLQFCGCKSRRASCSCWARSDATAWGR